VKIVILTLFPEMFNGPFKESIIKRALDAKKIQIDIVNFRDYALDKHKKVDDTPYGGGSGMVLKPEPLFDAVSAVKKDLKGNTKVIFLTPQGRVFNQECAYNLSKEENIILICGRYEGFDERALECLADDEISIGDYVLTGGEIPAMVIVDSVSRLIPGVLGNSESLNKETFQDNLLEYPQYTRPENFRGHEVPEIFLSGNHKEIENYRRQMSIKKTIERRPDLIPKMKLSNQEKTWVAKYIKKESK